MLQLEIGMITLFPEMFQALEYGIVGRALLQKIVNLQCWNPRDFTLDKHRTVDDAPYGGGPGMVMQGEPLRQAILAAKQQLGNSTKVIYLSPQGQRFDQQAAKHLATNRKLIVVAGRYEGVDQRLIDNDIDEQWSIGDYVISGGELAAMVIVDAMTRLLPGALGDEQSAQQDSFFNGLLDHPHYTRPAAWSGHKVPDVLLDGNHLAIARWRLKQSLGNTWLLRPDLLANYLLDDTEQTLLNEYINEHQTTRSES